MTGFNNLTWTAVEITERTREAEGDMPDQQFRAAPGYYGQWGCKMLNTSWVPDAEDGRTLGALTQLATETGDDELMSICYSLSQFRDTVPSLVRTWSKYGAA